MFGVKANKNLGVTRCRYLYLRGQRLDSASLNKLSYCRPIQVSILSFLGKILSQIFHKMYNMVKT